MFLSYEDVLNLPRWSSLFSEVKRQHYKIIYNKDKVLVKLFKSDWGLETRSKELSKDDIETNFYKVSQR
jgi:hypothetical protein